MSHFSQIQTRLKNIDIIRSVMSDLGYVELENNQECRGFFGDVIRADHVFHVSKNYDVGFVLTPSGTYELVGDWEILSKLVKMDQGSFCNQLSREYARKTIESYVSEHNYNFECVQHEDGSYQYIIEDAR